MTIIAPRWLPSDSQWTNEVFITIDLGEPERRLRIEEPLHAEIEAWSPEFETR